MCDKFKKRTILSKRTGKFIMTKYLFMYRRKYNQSSPNSLFDKNSKEVNLVQDGDKDTIDKYTAIFNKLIYNNCVIIPMVSEYALKGTFDNVSKLVNDICLKNDNRINGSSLVTRSRYEGYIKKFYKENPSNDILVNHNEMHIIKGRKVVILTDVINNNLSGYISYRSIIKEYNPKSIELVGLARYVES